MDRGLAQRIADVCNNRPQAWDTPKGFQAAGDTFEKEDARSLLDTAFKAVRDGDGRRFDFWEDLRFAPIISSI